MTAGVESAVRHRARLATAGLAPHDRAPLFEVAGPAERPPTVTAVIPTLNEASNIAHVIGRIPEWVEEIIVIDGDSTDGTCEMAKAARDDVTVMQQDGHGKGDALACGFAAAHGDIIVMLDADGSTDPAEIPRFVAALRTGADFAKGTRFAMGGGSADITRLRRIGNRALGGLVNRLWRVQYTDLCYGYNAFWRSCLPELHIDCAGFEVETLLNIKAARRQLRIVEVPSYEANRMSGASNLSARRDGVRILRTIIAERIRPD
ncbi:MAG TPA: glycosyltransferase family 2 protein [Acidimicrobiia bacterium]